MIYDVAVIGAGVIGTFIARELSRYDLSIALIERDSDVANGTSKANSGIVHAGYDVEEGTLKAKFNVKGNEMYEKVCSELHVPFKRIGSLVIATNEEEMQHIQMLYDRGIKNGVTSLKILDKEEVRLLEPNLDEDVIGALHAATCGIVGPFELTIALAENAVDNGAELMLNSEVIDLKRTKDGFNIQLKDGNKIKSKYVINAAGVYADIINNFVSNDKIDITPRKGEYFVFDKEVGALVNSVIFQCPTKLGKGVLVTPTVHGNILVGPNAENIEDKEGIDTTADGLHYLRDKASKTTKKIPFNKVITSFAGLRAVDTSGDFIIGESSDVEGLINVAGIQSPGLSSAPAIAKYIVDIIKTKIPNVKERECFINRREEIRLMELSNEEKQEVINRDKRYGNIVCRCEWITEGEIVDAIHRNAGATTVDGVKRRVRPGMGRCQGGFCGPRVVEILARELKVSPEEILKGNSGSNILSGVSKDNNLYGKAYEQVAANIEE
ncbi:NAD(P)/FAD-dependent oxidoreductase [Oceanirhabdus sp. W0125-5]|uniref:NAD(P)/FAD-dependent oxidoreductase n=1 Tax=Oceanirhabdus sp. W0125-5 TaxID=2999116 RepID=UPI0022F2B914|nr:NAD(P)/FAD-dependent oxidoreductase [Oceanirhabdus sp. W0125-5]WBW99246.1 NAD(P)/FAD-dependent oxidoreductase [Oceanirhabdus sp. W0125-5]